MIFLKPLGGLCNRLRTIESMISICEKLNKDLIVIWQSTEELNCKFSKLFLPIKPSNIKVRIIENKKIYNFVLKCCVSKKNIIENSYWESIYLKNRNQEKLSLFEADSKSFQEIEEKALQILTTTKENFLFESCYRLFKADIENYQCFQPTKDIEIRIKNITAYFKHTYGIHIRRTDHNRAIEISTDEKIEAKINSIIEKDPGTSFFLATDCEATKACFIKNFPDRIIANQDLTYNRNNPDSIKDAVVDLYCLAHTKKIYGSFYSSYSEVAAAITKTELVVIK